MKSYFLFPKDSLPHPVLMIRCTPLSVDTTSLISPTLSPNVASSNGFCICPGLKKPRSPWERYELQSEFLPASSENLLSSSLISDWNPRRISMASSLLRVIDFYVGREGSQFVILVQSSMSSLTSFQLDGFLLSLCFTSRWLARTWPGEAVGAGAPPPPPDKYRAAPGSWATCSLLSSAGGSQDELLVSSLKKYGTLRLLDIRTSHCHFQYQSTEVIRG